MTTATREMTVTLRRPHALQQLFIESTAPRKIIRAGRRSGKTVGLAIMAVQAFLAGKRVLYAAPTQEQAETFWFEVKRSLKEPLDANAFYKNESMHIVDLVGTKQRIRAKTAYNADTLRGDYADLLILDEWQLMAEDTWNDVGAPMLLDNNGSAVFLYTPPSLRSSGVSKARDPRHASKMFKQAAADTTGRWAAFHFTSHDNPYLSVEALNEITSDMSPDSYRKEILAEDEDVEQSWMVYGRFNQATQIKARFPIPDKWLRYVGHDFGAANPAALFLAENPETGDFYAYREYLPGPGRSTAQHVEEFKAIVGTSNVIKRVGGNQTTEDEIRQGYTAHGWFITAPKHKEVKVQIDKVLGLMALNKLYVFSDMRNYLEELNNCLWVLDEQNKPTDKIKDESKYHLCACARYILSDFTPETAYRGIPGAMPPSRMVRG